LAANDVPLSAASVAGDQRTAELLVVVLLGRARPPGCGESRSIFYDFSCSSSSTPGACTSCAPQTPAVEKTRKEIISKEIQKENVNFKLTSRSGAKARLFVR
jgi:hypothetical protein